MNKFAGLLPLCLLIAVTANVASPKSPQNSNITVEKIVVATSVSSLEPAGADTKFPASVGTLYCWTKVNTASVPASITHKWFRDDKQVFEYKLDLKWSSTRTWSRKSVTPGKWRVDVTDDSGAVLSSVSLIVN